MRSCQDYERLISADLDGRLSGEEKRELAEHLAQCPACRGFYEDAKAIQAALKDGQNRGAPAGFLENVMEHLPEQEERKRRTFPLWKRIAASAACLMLVLTGLWTVSSQGADPDREAAPPMARTATFAMETGEAAPAGECPALQLLVEEVRKDCLLCTDGDGVAITVERSGSTLLVNGEPQAGDVILVTPDDSGSMENGVVQALSVERLP